MKKMNDYIKIGNHQFQTLVAVTDQEHQQGLKYYSWPPPIMSFYFKKAELHPFWMKDTPSPLDLIFCCDNKIIDIVAGTPFALHHIGPTDVTDLVVEVPANFSNKAGIKIGQSVHLQLSIKTTARLFQHELSKIALK